MGKKRKYYQRIIYNDEKLRIYKEKEKNTTKKKNERNWEKDKII